MAKKSVVVLLDGNKNVVAAMDPTIAHNGISHEISPRAGQTLVEVEVPAAVGEMSPVDFRKAIGEAMKSPEAVKPWKSQRPEAQKKRK
jgi:hypothetical protein